MGTNQVYDPATDAWQSRNELAVARDHLAAASIGDRIYAGGGRLTSYARNLSITEVYDPDLDEWIQRAPLPTTRSGIGAVAVGGRLYVFGGESTEGTFEENEVYYPASDQ